MKTVAIRFVVPLAASVALCVLGCEQKKPASEPAPQAATPIAPATVLPGHTDSTEPVSTSQQESQVSHFALDFKVQTIDGHEQDLSAYKGKVVVIVNVASKCGFTQQYEGLQEFYASRKDQGLIVLGFPANDFGQQEPGTEQEIQEFCSKTFNVTFPMFAKVTVKGEDAHPLYKRLAEQPKPIGGAPRWNFTKFVLDKQGNVVARFDAEKTYVGTAMLEPGLVAKVDELLKS